MTRFHLGVSFMGSSIVHASHTKPSLKWLYSMYCILLLLVLPAFKLQFTLRRKSLDIQIKFVLHLFFLKSLHSVGELTDWNEPDLSCVIIIRLAVARTSSNYFRQRVLYLNCALWEVFPFFSTEFIFCTSASLCSFVSLAKNSETPTYFILKIKCPSYGQLSHVSPHLFFSCFLLSLYCCCGFKVVLI